MQIYKTIDINTWPLKNLYKNITNINDILSGHPAADEIQLSGMHKPFLFNNNDKSACLSILLRMIIIQKMGIAADKFPSDQLVNQAIAEFVTLFQGLGDKSELYWLLNGVCWLRVLRANAFNENYKYPANLSLSTNDLKFADRDSIVEQYYTSLSNKVLGNYDERISRLINKKETKLKSLFAIMAFMDAGNFLLIVPQNLALCIAKLNQIGVPISIVFAVTTYGIYIVGRNETGQIVITEGVPENKQAGKVVCYLIYTGDGGDNVKELYKIFYQSFPSRLENILNEFYTKDVQMVNPEQIDGIKVQPMTKTTLPEFLGNYKERASILYNNM